MPQSHKMFLFNIFECVNISNIKFLLRIPEDKTIFNRLQKRRRLSIHRNVFFYFNPTITGVNNNIYKSHNNKNSFI